MGIADFLISAGLTNRDTEDLGALALAKSRQEIFTYCTSFKCCSYTEKKSDGKTVKKQHVRVIKKPNKDGVCPDCLGAILIRRGVHS